MEKSTLIQTASSQASTTSTQWGRGYQKLRTVGGGIRPMAAEDVFAWAQEYLETEAVENEFGDHTQDA